MIVTSKAKISLSLSASDTTIMHRAGMAGLYMTLKQLEHQFPNIKSREGNISWSLTPNTIKLFWEGSDFIALNWLLKQSFQLSKTGLIQLTGLNNNTIKLIEKIQIHQGICATFLRHNKFYKKQSIEKQKQTLEGKEIEHQYKSLKWYVHQTFAEELCDIETQQLKQDYIQFTSWLYLGGIVRHARLDKVTKLEDRIEYILALLYVPVVCQYFLYHLSNEDIKNQTPHRYSIVIPEINNFESASQRRWKLQQLETQNRHVSTTGESGLLYYSLDQISPKNNEERVCQVFLYEKMNPSSYQLTLAKIEEIEISQNTLKIYQLMQQNFQQNFQQIIKKKISIKINPVRSLIANNLATGKPWWLNLWEKLTQEDIQGYLHQQLLYNKTGLRFMIENSQQKENYLTFIAVFQKAMKRKFGIIYSKSEVKDKEVIHKKFQQKVEQLRAELNCCYDELSFQQYLADFLARGGLNQAFYQDKEKVLLLIEETPWEKLRIWSLLAIASYTPEAKEGDNNGKK